MEHKNMSIENLFEELQSSRNGLTEDEANSRFDEHGPNELKERKKVTPLKILLRQFANFIVWVLVAAAIISMVIGEIINFWAILAIILFVVILGFIQEYKAEKAMESLKKMVRPTSKLMRDGKIDEIPTRNIVPGDVLVLESGDRIPADGKIFSSASLKADEAALTGESTSVEKQAEDMVFAGTEIVHGKCKALVTKTGMDTKLGDIAGMIQEEEEKTPLQRNISSLAKNLALLALFASVLTVILGFFSEAPMAEMLIIALALAVASVPEGLPLTLTITLAMGMRRMAERKAIVRKMLGVETLGSTTIICSDKTGTLTKNEMTVERIITNDRSVNVSGAGYDVTGDFSVEDEQIQVQGNKRLETILKAAILCNNATLNKQKDETQLLGDPTELSLLIAGAKADLWKSELEEEYERIDEITFTSDRKMMTTVHQKNDKKIAFSKGAPEVILDKCKHIYKNGKVYELDEDGRSSILDKNHDLARSAYRVLGLASKNLSQSSDVEEEMTFLGLVAMIDPPREEVKEAIATCKKAGIKVAMITGDNQETAKAIGKKIGLFDEDKESINTDDEKLRKVVEDRAITGSELENLSDSELDFLVEKINIYARIKPEQKLRIVKALKNKNNVVAMTGDGVNDAPALKQADIGVAMGIKGTDVAKQSSTMILQDDNFATIVEAVKHGRTIYENIEKFTVYLISRNFTEVILILLGIILLGFEFLPLLALQILFINMFDEIMPSIGLGLDPVREEVMDRGPRDPRETIMKPRNLTLIISVALVNSLAAFLVFLYSNPVENIEFARTMTFATISSMIFFTPFGFRSLEKSVFRLGFLDNKLLVLGVSVTFALTLIAIYIPFINTVFELTPLGLTDWIIPMGVAFGLLLIIEGLKKMVNMVVRE